MSRSLSRRALLLAPTFAALAGGAALLILDERPRPRALPPLGGSRRLIGRKLPAFSLPGPAGQSGFNNTDVAAAGQPVLLNFFASWCVPCLLELPALLRLASGGLAIWGIDFRDRSEDAAAWLRANGNPYQRVAYDTAGRTGREFGLLGVPESFLVDRSGIVSWHWAGGLSADIVAQYLDPLLRPGA